ncbi:hypothetical protein [Gordonia malaquae]|uniref:hypothetical protein n=1 Tax=Gordonia malaquae TaxID=410332 RepID=UPI003016D6A7
MATITDIQEHPVMKEVLNDSFGGVMYNVANRGKYDATDLLEQWDTLSQGEQDAAGGILRGAIGFLRDISPRR